MVKNSKGKVVHSAKGNAGQKDNGKIVLATELELILCVAEMLGEEEPAKHEDEVHS